MTDFDLPEPIQAAIAAEAARALPREACGVLLGNMAEGSLQVTRHRPVQNDTVTSASYAIPGDVVLAIQREGEQDGMDVVGFYHSHPHGPAGPSPTDLEHALPGFLYVIADARTGMVTAWRLRDDRRAFEPADG